MSDVIPFERYPDLPPLFLDFLRGVPDIYPDPPSVESIAKRGRDLLGRPSRLPVEAFRHRGGAAEDLARDLAEGRAVAVVTGHQIGLFTGPLFTVVKAFDAIRLASELTERGVPAVPIFWALTDDHDLEEIAKTVRPGAEGPETIVLEGADRTNRRPVGDRPLPSTVADVLEGFRPQAKAADANELLQAIGQRYRPGTSYADAFVETLLDFVGAPLLVLDPSSAPIRKAAAELFQSAVSRAERLPQALSNVEQKLAAMGRTVVVSYRGNMFPFFAVDSDNRRRIEDAAAASARLSEKDFWISADVLTRPLLKSLVMPVAASVLGPSEIAYHAQALALFPIFDLPRPVLMPRSHVVPLGPPERRAAEAFGIPLEALFEPLPVSGGAEVAEARQVEQLAGEAESRLSALEPSLRALDASLTGALETTHRKIAYQFGQLAQRIRKAADRKDEVTLRRRQRLETMVCPLGQPADRVYSPLVPMLAYGRAALEPIRRAARGDLRGGIVTMLGGAAEEGSIDVG